MRELLRTNDPVLISFVEALIMEAGLAYHVADANTSAMEGSIGIFPRRVLVADDDFDVAYGLMHDAGLAKELRELVGGHPNDVGDYLSIRNGGSG